MTQQQIIESEKIAVFMEFEKIPNAGYLCFPDCNDHGMNRIYPPFGMKFSTSWDWIMRAIQHIGQKTGFTLVIEEATSYWVNSGDYGCDNQQFGGYGDIDNIFEAVVEFIDWHNSQNLDLDGNPACKVYKGETVLPNEDGKCSLCEGDCTEQ